MEKPADVPAEAPQLRPRVSPLGMTLARVSSLARTRFYYAVTGALWRIALPYTEVVRNARRRDLDVAYALHMEVLSRPGMRRVFRRIEREDLLTFPLFVVSIPLDLARVVRKRLRRRSSLAVRPRDGFPYPAYYLHDFHHQSNGNLSLFSALTYEWQIRFLFLGTNRLMRQGIVDAIPEGDHLDILDVACGTGAWITMARLQNRHHRVTGVDLSPEYLRLARRFRGRGAEFIQMNAERLDPAWTDRFDVVTCIWLFHELPRPAIANAMAELVRVLKPGGLLVFMDSIQVQDGVRPEVRDMAERFFDFFAEPYFLEYQDMDLDELFRRHGLVEESRQFWFHSKVVTLRKPA